MFKELSKFFTTQRTILILIVLILAFVIYIYSDSKYPSKDGYTGVTTPYVSTNTSANTAANTAMTPPQNNSSSASDNVFIQNNGIVAPPTTNNGGYIPKNTGAPSDLLPKGQASSQFSDFNMLSQGSNIAMPDLLDAGYLIGLDTIGQSLRNANYQERSDPIIPKVNIGPWNNSTIEPDLGRVPLEIGCGLR